MCAQFSPAFDYTIRNEDPELTGTIVEEPNGGRARFGINSLFHPKAVTDSFYTMTRDTAFRYCVKLLRSEYWDKPGFAKIEDQKLATKLFDITVAMGNGGAIAILQNTLDCYISHILDDNTLAAIKESKSNLLNELVVTLKAHYLILYQTNTIKYRGVINNLLLRATKLPLP